MRSVDWGEQGRGLKIAAERNFFVDLDLKSPEMAFISEHFIDATIREAEVSPSGNLMVVNVGGSVLVLLDAHALQIVSINTLNQNSAGRVSLNAVSHIKFISEYLLVSIEKPYRLLLWRNDTKKLFPLIYLDPLDLPEANPEEYSILKVLPYQSDTKALVESRFRGKFWTRSPQSRTVTYAQLIELKVLASWLVMEPSKKSRSVLEELRLLNPSYLLVLDSEMQLSMVWTDLLQLMYAPEPKSVHKDQISVGYSLTTDKLVQSIRHSETCQSKDVLELRDKSKLRLRLPGKEVADFAVASVAGKKLLVVLYLNLQLQILNFDLLSRGFMEHSAYNENKR